MHTHTWFAGFARARATSPVGFAWVSQKNGAHVRACALARWRVNAYNKTMSARPHESSIPRPPPSDRVEICHL